MRRARISLRNWRRTVMNFRREVLDWRQLAKLKSTYTDALVEAINPGTGRIHTSYSMTGASTGRLSSNDPNLQNIPIRSEEGREDPDGFHCRAGPQVACG